MDFHGDGSSVATGESRPPPPPPLKEGWLMKSDKNGRNWQRRWCVISAGMFVYYVDPESTKEKGSFELDKAEFRQGWPLGPRYKPTDYIFQLVLPERTYYLGASTRFEMEEWAQALATAQGRSLEELMGWGGDRDDAGSVRGSDRGSVTSSTVWMGHRSGTQASVRAPHLRRGGESERSVSPRSVGRARSKSQPMALALTQAQGSRGDRILFFVYVPTDAQGTAVRRVRMALPLQKAQSVRVKSIKQNLASRLPCPPSDVQLQVDGDPPESVLDDDMRGRDFGLVEGMHLRVLLPSANESAEEQNDQTASPGGQGTAGTGSKSYTFDDTEEALGGAGSPLPPVEEEQERAHAARRSATEARLERRMKLNELFASLPGASTEQGPHRGSVSCAALAALLRSDPETKRWRGIDALLDRLDRYISARITWAALLNILREEREAMDAPEEQPKNPPAPPSPGLAASPQGGFESAAGAGQPVVPVAVPTVPAGVRRAASEARSSLDDLDAQTAVGAMEQRHVMVMTVDINDDQSGEIHVRPGEDPEQLAQEFFERFDLPEESYGSALTMEIRKVLTEAYDQQLATVTEQRDRATEMLRSLVSAVEIGSMQQEEQEQEQGREAVEGPSSLASRLQQAEEERDMLQSRLRALQSQSGASGVASAASSGGDVASLRRALEELRQENALLRESPSASSSSAGAGASRDKSVLTRDEWRQWSEEKRRLLQKANEDRSSLMAENRRLRAALSESSSGTSLEARLRHYDEEKADLEQQVSSLLAAQRRAETEVREIRRQYETASRQWATEKRRLSDQVESLANAAARAASDGARVASEAAGAEEVGASASEVQRLLQEKATIMQNWSQEAKILVSAWREDKHSWTEELEVVRHRVQMLQENLATARRELEVEDLRKHGRAASMALDVLVDLDDQLGDLEQQVAARVEQNYAEEGEETGEMAEERTPRGRQQMSQSGTRDSTNQQGSQWTRGAKVQSGFGVGAVSPLDSWR